MNAEEFKSFDWENGSFVDERIKACRSSSLTINQVCEFFKLSENVIQKMIRAEKMPLAYSGKDNRPMWLEADLLLAMNCGFNCGRQFRDDSNRWKWANFIPCFGTYFIEEIGTGLVKIGKSSNVRTRIGRLQVGNPRELRLAALSFVSEESAHNVFLADHVRGEWFQFTDKTDAFISDNATAM